jgi:hypothetical protein
MFKCCRRNSKDQLSFKQLSFICWAALIRGSIAFGLVLRLRNLNIFSNEDLVKLEIIESSTSLLVISTTIIFGSFTALV